MRTVLVIAGLSIAAGAVAFFVKTERPAPDLPVARGGGPAKTDPPNVCRTPDGVEYSCAK